MDGIRKRVNKVRRLLKQGYVVDGRGRPLHRHVCSKAWGRFPVDWVVHHIDLDKTNNHPDNLIAMPRRLHEHLHKVMAQNKVRFDREAIKGYLKPYRNPYEQK